MSRRKAIDYRMKCEAPTEEFIAFAKGLMAQQRKNSLNALAKSSSADAFAKRLMEQALGGHAHGPTCMPLVAHFAKDPFWAERLRSHATGYPPPPDQLRPKEVEPV